MRAAAALHRCGPSVFSRRSRPRDASAFTRHPAQPAPHQPRPAPCTRRLSQQHRRVNVASAARAAAAVAACTASSATRDDRSPPAITFHDLGPFIEIARPTSTKSSSPTRKLLPLPLPVLVGWFGCQRTHLRKYAEFYLAPELGMDAVVLIRPPAAATLVPALGDAYAAMALRAMELVQRRLAEEGEGAEGEAAAAEAAEAQAAMAQGEAQGVVGDADAVAAEAEAAAKGAAVKAAEAGAAAAGPEIGTGTGTAAAAEAAAEARTGMGTKTGIAGSPRPLLLHLFSNGGYLFAGNLLHAHAPESSATAPGAQDLSLQVRRRLGLAPEPAAARRFTANVTALVMDSAPGELEPGMVSKSFQAVLGGEAAPRPGRAVQVDLRLTPG